MDVTVVSARPSIHLITVPNAGPLTLTGTNTYVIGELSPYLVDPGPDDCSHLRHVLSWFRDRRKPQGILLTHLHADHAGGATALANKLNVPVFYPESASLARFEVDGETVHAIPTPGHTREHVAFWMPTSRILLSGDVVLGTGTSVVAPPEGDMRAYMRTLESLQQLAPALILPGHGPPITDPAAVLTAYIKHRVEREGEVLRAVASVPLTPAEIVSAVYVGLSEDLVPWAEGSVRAQLDKLLHEGKVREQDGTYFEVIRQGGSQL